MFAYQPQEEEVEHVKKFLVLSAMVSACFVGCGDGGSDDSAVEDAIDAVTEAAEEAIEDVGAAAEEAMEEVGEAAEEAVEEVEEAAEEAIEDVGDATEESMPASAPAE